MIRENVRRVCHVVTGSLGLDFVGAVVGGSGPIAGLRGLARSFCQYFTESILLLITLPLSFSDDFCRPTPMPPLSLAHLHPTRRQVDGISNSDPLLHPPLHHLGSCVTGLESDTSNPRLPPFWCHSADSFCYS